MKSTDLIQYGRSRKASAKNLCLLRYEGNTDIMLVNFGTQVAFRAKETARVKASG